MNFTARLISLTTSTSQATTSLQRRNTSRRTTEKPITQNSDTTRMTVVAYSCKDLCIALPYQLLFIYNILLPHYRNRCIICSFVSDKWIFSFFMEKKM